MHFTVIALTGLLLTLSLASCGGGSSGTTTATATPPTTPAPVTPPAPTPTPTPVASVVSTVALSPSTNTLNPGATFQITASLQDSTGASLTGRSVAWSSSNLTIASVSSSGVVAGVAPGSATITASSEGKSATASVTVANAAASTVTVKVDAAKPGSAIRDLQGVNKKPTASSQTPGTSWDGKSLYAAFGVSQVRLHDASVDLCTTYKAANKLNSGVSPAQAVSGCTLAGSGSVPHFTWTPTSSADADLNNPDNYDFSQVDEALSSVLASGASVYLRLGESFNGPNDTADPVAWAKVATNIYKHVLGTFKPTAGIALNPVYVEVFNEPDGGFWRGDQATFNTLFIETAQRVRAAAAAANRSVKVGGPGFTKSVLTSSTKAGNPANGFVAAVGASTLDFFSAHLYESCETATLSSAASYLRAVRALADSQGASGKPLQITEWNIGLGSQCGNDFFSQQRTQSFDSGVLTLMQDPAQNIEAAHYYAAMPLMALFDFSSVAGAVRINPSAWALWAHAKLKGTTALDSQVCPTTGSCLKGYAAESINLLALAGQTGNVQNMVVTNDTTAAVTYTLQISGLSSATVTITISTPPAGSRDLATTGNPAVTNVTALAGLLASVSKDTRANLDVSAGQIKLTLTLPANTLQYVDVRAP
jgi:hypothetical protein